MKTEIIDVSPTRKELKIEIDAADVRAEYDRVSDRYAEAATVPGFRRGRAPRTVVRQRFKNEIRGEVVQNLIPSALEEAITESDLHVIGEPDIQLANSEGLEKLGDQPLQINAQVEVLPDFALGQYKGLEAERRTRPVTDETVEAMLNDLRESSASLQPVEERAAEAGDTVTVNFVGKYIEPPETEDIKAEDVDVLLGGDGVLQDFTDQLTGTRADDARTFTVKYPDDFSSTGLAGKEIEYTATVTAVRRKELPELDDEFAKSFGEEVESLTMLREKMRENLEQRARAEADHHLRDELMGKLIGAHEFAVPESLVQSQSRRLLESTVRDMMQRGIDPRQEEVDWEHLQTLMRTQSEADLRASLIIERVADAEQIDATDAEIEEEINRIAMASRQTPEQVKAALTKQGGERSIADRLRHRKALDLIVDSARVSDAEWREEAPEVEATDAPSDAAETNATGEATPTVGGEEAAQSAT